MDPLLSLLFYFIIAALVLYGIYLALSFFKIPENFRALIMVVMVIIVLIIIFNRIGWFTF